MFKIKKDPSETLESVFTLLEPTFPGATIKKPFLSPKTIFIPYENFTVLLRDKKKFLFGDFILPKSQHRWAAFLVGAVGIQIWKGIFKSRRKESFNNFIHQAETAINGVGTIDSIGQQLV